jgi:sulfite exporter TauE/SafE
MLWQFIITGFALGITSSLHCVGMCGPLMFALPVQHTSTTKRIVAILLYQVGRVISYSALGFVLGLAGRKIYLAGFQQWFSIGMGILILLLIIQYWIFRKGIQAGFLNGFYIAVQRIMIRVLRAKGIFSFLLFGIANGFLPCGMVYIAVAGALAATEVYQSVSFMTSFGLGTLPAMMTVAFSRQFFSLRARNSFRKIVPILVSMMAILLILRGMNLGIPFISPILQPPSSSAVSCH